MPAANCRHPLNSGCEIGVKTPIVVDGPIAGIRYAAGGNGPLIADCRLVLALALMGPALTSLGVSDVRFSGAYVFRLSNKGRVSLHAYGLAIDLHGFTRFGVHYEVEHDFHKGLGTKVKRERLHLASNDRSGDPRCYPRATAPGSAAPRRTAQR